MIASRTEIRGPDVARHYDELDRFYREIWGERVHHGLWHIGHDTPAEAGARLEHCVAEEAALQPGDTVCDIGCGYGATARLLAREQGARVTAITISTAQHAIATRQSAGHRVDRDDEDDEDDPRDRAPRFLLGDWLANELPAESFHAAIAIESSEHMADKAAFFAQAHRVLRPGGRLVVATWLVQESPAPAWRRRWLLEPICRECRMPQLGSESEYRRLAAAAGFAVRRFREVTREAARTWPVIARTFAAHLLRHPAAAPRILRAPGAGRHCRFALTVARLCLAFRIGALRYGIFTLHKPGA